MALVLVLLGVVVALFRLILCSQRTDCCPFAVSEGVSAAGCRYVVKLGSWHFHLMRRSFLVDGSLPSRYYYWLSCLLFLAGDIALNPGPARFPCTVCARPVRVNQRGIQCDGCDKWTHASCSNMSRDLYTQLEAHVEFSWRCPSCLFQELPLFDCACA